MTLLDISKNRNPKLLLNKAEDTMFKLQDICKWDNSCVKNNLKNNKKLKNIPFIKLRGDDRIDNMKSYFQN